MSVQARAASTAETARGHTLTARAAQQRLNLSAQQQKVDTLFKQAGLKLDMAKYDLAVKREQRLARNKSGKKGGFTPSQLSKFHATAIDTVKDWKHGVPATTYADGSVKTAAVPGRPQDPRGAFRYLINHGIPASIADDAVGKVYGKWK